MGREIIHHQRHQEHQEITKRRDDLARLILRAGLTVHKALGPGLLESSYEHCLAYELDPLGLTIVRQAALPIKYRGTTLDAGYRLDIIVENTIVIEIKAVEALTPLHAAQVLTYLKPSGYRLGFLMNFNVTLFKNGIRRLIL